MWLAGWSYGVVQSLWMDCVVWLGCCLMSCGGYVWQLLQRQQQPMATMLAQQQYALAQQQQQMGRDQCFEPALLCYVVPHATYVVICLNPIQVSLSICYIVEKKYALFILFTSFVRSYGPKCSHSSVYTCGGVLYWDFTCKQTIPDLCF